MFTYDLSVLSPVCVYFISMSGGLHKPYSTNVHEKGLGMEEGGVYLIKEWIEGSGETWIKN